MRHLKYLATGTLATAIALVILGCVIAIFVGMFWIMHNYPNVATAFAVLGFIYILGACIIEQREAEAIRAEREAYHKDQADKLRDMADELTGRSKDGMV